jgi:hypothetical protein
MTASGNPVGNKFVASLARPGGNITGLTTIRRDLTGKRLELLKETSSKISRVAVLWGPPAAANLKDAENAAQLLGLELRSWEVGKPEILKTRFNPQPRNTLKLSLRSEIRPSSINESGSRSWPLRSGFRRSMTTENSWRQAA